MAVFFRDLHKKVPEVFGLRDSDPLGTTDIKDASGNIIDRIVVQTCWIAEVEYYQPQVSGDELVVAVIQTNRWRKGAILIHPQGTSPLDALGGPRPMYAVDVGDWEDPVAAALQSANVFPEKVSDWLAGSHTHRYGIKFATIRTRGSFRVDPGPVKEYPAFQNLWNALYHTVEHFAALYNNAEINTYVHDRGALYGQVFKDPKQVDLW